MPSPDPHQAMPPCREPGHSARREQILDIALRLFAQNGMANVTTRQIAQMVGISQPSLYAHFRSKDAIGAELCARAFDTLTRRLAEVAAAPTSPAERLVRMCEGYIAFGLEHPDMYRIAFMLEDSHACHMPVPTATTAQDPDDPVMLAGLRAFNVLYRVVAELRGDDNEATMLAAQSIWAHVHGLVSLLIARPDFPWAEHPPLIATHLAGVVALARGAG